MKTTKLFNRIIFTVTSLLITTTITLAAKQEPQTDFASKSLKVKTLNFEKHSPKTDSYVMVMPQQVEKGDQSITYSFYIDQLQDIYKKNQLISDIDINLEMLKTENIK